MTIDRVARLNRSYSETYTAKEDFIKNPGQVYASRVGLAARENDQAFQLLLSDW